MVNYDTSVLLSFILLLIIASFTAYYASRAGRNPMIWFAIGVLLGIFAPLLLFFLNSMKPQKGEDGYPTMIVSPPDKAVANLPPHQPSPEELKLQEEENRLWYYLDQNHTQIGPVSVIALRDLWNRGMLEEKQYVWSEGMAQWEKVENLPELKAALNKAMNF